MSVDSVQWKQLYGPLHVTIERNEVKEQTDI